MFVTPPAPEELARWLLTHEAGELQSAEEFVAAAERAYVRLREPLTVFLGPPGFDSLWARAMHLARRRHHWDVPEVEGSPTTPLHWLHAAVRGRDSAVAGDILMTAFASFISLLFTFIGEDLGLRLFRQVWPEVPLNEADVHGGEASQ